MPWSIAAPVIGAVASSALSSGGGGSSGGGAGSGTQSKEPWAPAQPWIMNNLAQGQNLQSAYTAQPFSQLQNQAYNNQNNQSAYMRAVVPGLLAQLSGQPTGYDRNNQNARPQAFDFASDGVKGLLAQMASGANNASPMQNTPQVQQPQQDQGNFTQQTGIIMPPGDGTQGLGTGGYGTFKYGMDAPAPGSQAYRDMSEYLARGGADPYGFYGPNGQKKYVSPGTNPYAYMLTSGGSGGNGIGTSGNSVGGSPSGDGSGGGAPGPW